MWRMEEQPANPHGLQQGLSAKYSNSFPVLPSRAPQFYAQLQNWNNQGTCGISPFDLTLQVAQYAQWAGTMMGRCSQWLSNIPIEDLLDVGAEKRVCQRHPTYEFSAAPQRHQSGTAQREREDGRTSSKPFVAIWKNSYQNTSERRAPRGQHVSFRAWRQMKTSVCSENMRGQSW